MKCPSCQGDVLDIDVKCAHCGFPLGATGAHRMIGTLVLGTYELVDVLGQGGMSVVFKAKHKMTDQGVALKILPPELAAHSQVKSRFLDEAKALAALDHPNIVHLYNFGQENGSFVLAMQYVEGQTWERLILENKRLDWKISCRIAIDVLKALEYAHGRGVIHRDMKPSNVLVRQSDGAATVMDFGIAKMTTSTRLTATGQTMGTVRYMSPEQVRGQEVDLRTDIYSLGATLYESLVGDTPFDGSTHFEIMTKHLSELPKPPSTLGIQMPREVENALMRSLAKRALDRFDVARDMRKVIENALREGDVGLVETQRLQRELLGDAKVTKEERKAASAALAPTTRAATANELADELEPETPKPTIDAPRTPKKKSKWPWIVLALLVLGGGAATAAVLLLGQRKPTYQSVTRAPGVTQGQKVGDVMIETSGKVSPDVVAKAYEDAVKEITALDPNVKGTFHVIDTIAAIPAARLCDPRFVHTGNAMTGASKNCEPSEPAVPALLGAKGHMLLVSDDPATLPQAMRYGVARAICDFAPSYLDDKKQEDREKLGAICELSLRFAGAK